MFEVNLTNGIALLNILVKESYFISFYVTDKIFYLLGKTNYSDIYISKEINDNVQDFHITLLSNQTKSFVNEENHKKELNIKIDFLNGNILLNDQTFKYEINNSTIEIKNNAIINNQQTVYLNPKQFNDNLNTICKFCDSEEKYFINATQGLKIEINLSSSILITTCTNCHVLASSQITFYDTNGFEDKINVYQIQCFKTFLRIWKLLYKIIKKDQMFELSFCANTNLCYLTTGTGTGTGTGIVFKTKLADDLIPNIDEFMSKDKYVLEVKLNTKELLNAVNSFPVHKDDKHLYLHFKENGLEMTYKNINEKDLANNYLDYERFTVPYIEHDLTSARCADTYNSRNFYRQGCTYAMTYRCVDINYFKQTLKSIATKTDFEVILRLYHYKTSQLLKFVSGNTTIVVALIQI